MAREMAGLPPTEADVPDQVDHVEELATMGTFLREVGNVRSLNPTVAWAGSDSEGDSDHS